MDWWTVAGIIVLAVLLLITVKAAFKILRIALLAIAVVLAAGLVMSALQGQNHWGKVKTTAALVVETVGEGIKNAENIGKNIEGLMNSTTPLENETKQFRESASNAVKSLSQQKEKD